MKKIFLLLLIITACSESSVDDFDSNTNDTSPAIIPETITFTVQEVWGSKLTWNEENTFYIYNQEICGEETPTLSTSGADDLTGFETNKRTHYCLDTLVINLERSRSYEKPEVFDFDISSRGNFFGTFLPYPKRIGHIEFIGFDNDKKIVLQTIFMEIANGGERTQIDYYSSNMSEEFIESITFDGWGYKNYNCTPKKVFYKKDFQGNYYESTVFEITVPKDNSNSALKIGDTIGRGQYSQIILGEGWDSRFNNNYLILNKN